MSAIRVDYVSDWAARLKTRLYTQFRDATTWQAWCDLLGRQMQDLEDSAQTLFSLLDIDNSSGTELDVIGRIVGQPRLGTDDVTYRLYLRARIIANNSTGTPENLYDVFRALLGTSVGYVVTTSAVGVKTFTMRLKTAVMRAQAVIGAKFLGDAKEAGARGLLEFQEVASSALFTYDGTAAQAYDVGVYAGVIQG